MLGKEHLGKRILVKNRETMFSNVEDINVIECDDKECLFGVEKFKGDRTTYQKWIKREDYEIIQVLQDLE